MLGLFERSLAGQKRRSGFLFALPAFIFFGFFYIFPLFQTFNVSLFNWDLLSVPEFVGTRNYSRLYIDKEFINSIWVTFYYVFGTVVIIWIIALGLALVFNQTFRLRQFYLTIYYLPAVISLTVWTLVWLLLYNPSFGVWSVVAGFFGVRYAPILDDPDTAMVGLIILSVWKGTPVYMLIFLAGLRAIPNDYYEAATVDGANVFQKFLHITIPLLRPVILYVAVISVIEGFKVFTPMYVLTHGGPGSATRVLPMFIFQNGFQYLKMGYASAASVIFLLILLVLSLLQFRILRLQQD